MPMKKRDHAPRPPNTRKPRSPLGAMAYAQKVAADYQALETGYRNGRYKLIGSALTSYRKFLKDTVGYEELLGQDNIAGLREKPDLKTTSRLVLYYLTGARNEPERNTAGKYARVVDYIHKEGIDSAAAADYVRTHGIDEILKKARKGEALKAAEDAQQADDPDFDHEEEPDDADDLASSDATDDLFDPEQDASLRLGSEALELVLSPEIPMNEVFYLECRKTGSIGRNGIRIEGRLFDPESE